MCLTHVGGMAMSLQDYMRTYSKCHVHSHDHQISASSWRFYYVLYLHNIALKWLGSQVFSMQNNRIITDCSSAVAYHLGCMYVFCLRCFDAVGWAAGRASGLQKNWALGCWCGCLSGARCREYADLHMPNWCHWHSLCLASVKSRSVLPFWCQLTWVVPEKGR